MPSYAKRATLPVFAKNSNKGERTAARLRLAAVVKQLRRSYPHIEIKKAWVHTCNGVDWDFHGLYKYLIVVKATNAYDARAKGWVAWLATKGIKV